MTAATETVRSQGFMPLESDIPAGLTLAQWRARRPRPARVSQRPLLRRRAQRPVVAA
jgi:hypothetical protein